MSTYKYVKNRYALTYTCQLVFSRLASLVVIEKGLQMPGCHEKAKQLYVTIIDEIEKFETKLCRLLLVRGNVAPFEGHLASFTAVIDVAFISLPH